MNEFLFLTSWFVPLYSLLGAILTLPWGLGIIQRTGPRPAAYLNLLTTILGFVHSLLVFKDIWNREPENLVITWFQAADFQLSFALEIFRSQYWGNSFNYWIKSIGANLCPGLHGKRLVLSPVFRLIGIL